MNSQMTFLAFGAKCGFPSGGRYASSDGASAALSIPSRRSIPVSARPAKPIPQSTNRLRRLIRPHGGKKLILYTSTHSNELVVIQQSVNQVFTRTLLGIRRRRHVRIHHFRRARQTLRISQDRGLRCKKLA